MKRYRITTDHLGHPVVEQVTVASKADAEGRYAVAPGRLVHRDWLHPTPLAAIEHAIEIENRRHDKVLERLLALMERPKGRKP